MSSPLPNSDEIAQLAAFLPRLYAPRFEPVDRWLGGTRDEHGVWTLPYPEYNPVVVEFFTAAGAACWSDYRYRPETAAAMLQTPGVVESASLTQLKTMLTYCTRGERFADGHWAEMIEQGHIRRILVRLQAFRAANRAGQELPAGSDDAPHP